MSWYPRKTVGEIAGTLDAAEDQGFIAHYNASPAAPDTTTVLAFTAQVVTETTTVTAGITNPDVPRTLQIDGEDSGQTGNVVITGTNAKDEIITETIALNGQTAVAGTKAFKTVTQIVLPPWNADGNKVSVGYGAKLGLMNVLPVNTPVLKAFFDGTEESTYPTMARDVDELEKNLMTMDSTLDGSVVDVYYMI